MFRYSDAPGIASQANDFVRRKRHGRTGRVSLIYSFVLAAVLGYLISQNYLETDRALVGIVFVTFIGMIAHALFMIQRSLDLVMAVEFQNALFSATINSGFDFTIILRRDGNVVYADRGFRRLFPALRTIDERVIDYLIGAFELDEDARIRLLEAIGRQQEERLVADLKGESDNIPYVLHLLPLPRPHGFTVLQGRVFVSNRSALKVDPSEASS